MEKFKNNITHTPAKAQPSEKKNRHKVTSRAKQRQRWRSQAQQPSEAKANYSTIPPERWRSRAQPSDGEAESNLRAERSKGYTLHNPTEQWRSRAKRRTGLFFFA